MLLANSDYFLLPYAAASSLLIAYAGHTAYRLWRANASALPALPPATDAHRDNTLKLGVKKVQQREYDAIVIGSGLGGLTTAALLARQGKQVLVLEQHDTAGGCCHAFVEHGFPFESGVHYLGGLKEGLFDRQLFDYVTDGDLDWACFGDAYDVVDIGPGKEQYTWVQGMDRNVARLSKRFPEDAAKIERFFAMAKEASKAFKDIFTVRMMPRWLRAFVAPFMLRSFHKYNSQTALEVVRGLDFANKELETILTYIYGDYGTPPDQAPFTLHAAVIFHYRNGAYFPVGGSGRIAETAVPVIRRAGGEVAVRATVEQILVEDGRAVGVRIAKTGTEFRAPLVVSSAGVHVTNKLLPAPVAHKVTTPHKPGVGHGYLFLGLNKSNAELNLPKTNLWAVCASSGIEDLSAEHHRLFDMATPPENLDGAAFIAFPSAKDPNWDAQHPGKSNCIVVFPMPYEWVEAHKDGRVRHRGAEYEAFKAKLEQLLVDKVKHHYPQITDDVIAYREAATPLSNNFYLGRERGESYGLDHTIERFADLNLGPATAIDGLYLTGHDILTCGVMSALVAGMMTVMAATGRAVPRDVMAWYKNEGPGRRTGGAGEKKKA